MAAADQPDLSDQLEAARAGDRRALARLLSVVERGGARAHELGRRTHELAGRGYTIGLTGAPGAGKSTLTSAMVGEARTRGNRISVLAIDPSSPFTGGAILGDRVRMSEHALDEGVFIRSMASRGHLGGLALAAPEAVRLLDAAGYPWIVLETVGVGQVEVEVVGTSDTTVVVVNPGWGDAVQANKAGLMEIADIFVVNKADRDGTRQTVRELESMLDITGTGGHDDWRPPVVTTVASEGTGVEDLWDAIEGHRAHIEASGELDDRRTARLHDEVTRIVHARLRARAEHLVDQARREVTGTGTESRVLDPWSAADAVLAGLDV